MNRVTSNGNERLGKQIGESVFGPLEAASGFRRLLPRRRDEARGERAMPCTANNPLSLAPARG